ncbi:hypothetical protein ROZALSC1DRAFT_30104 [Rozella allomycis CSF55]|uniref:Uncharacterized protein n=1 Tax=Rozella allomycis (strain CSF55) TaxID=988480 RepID=A0A075B0Z4_ROZAC|nr:hypothetical protein O9G_003864 [Rozella allomycis CSF55]RKP18174.1 hypothetical protein ROZALSC1DRAFT_30104 [Rozella allomycis CSF55]|eukprot:EPZ36239.1 hypothetical protein O9G_003864 [Rozella allomycis CSF55]
MSFESQERKSKSVVSEALSLMIRFKIDVIFGLEYWQPSFLREILAINGKRIEPGFPLAEFHPYDISDPIPLVKYPMIYAADNPSNAALVKRMDKRFKYANISYEMIDFGNLEDVHTRMPWIKTHVSKTPFNTDEDLFDFHLLATFTAYEFISKLAESTVEAAIYLETDAVPVYNAHKKFSLFYHQLKRHMPYYDIAMLGSCLQMERGHGPIYLADNLAKFPGTRCFNAVLMTRKAAKKIMEHGTANTPHIAIDFIINQLILEIPLEIAWAQEPLFYEESKTPPSFRFQC